MVNDTYDERSIESYLMSKFEETTDTWDLSKTVGRDESAPQAPAKMRRPFRI
jgi:hypothetical protein